MHCLGSFIAAAGSIPSWPSSDFLLHIQRKSALCRAAQQSAVGGGGFWPMTAGRHSASSLIVTLQIVFGVPAFAISMYTVISAKSNKVTHQALAIFAKCSLLGLLLGNGFYTSNKGLECDKICGCLFSLSVTVSHVNPACDFRVTDLGPFPQKTEH